MTNHALSNAGRRALMPIVTLFIDDIKAAFGAENIVRIYASENGLTVDWRRNG